MAEIERFFVEEAPQTARRRTVFAAFTVWVEAIRELCPNAILWVNGGFATHKSAPPKDVDVAVLIKPSDMASWTPEQEAIFESLITAVGPPRIQPMGGLVDGFYAVRGDASQTQVWHDSWSAVYIDQVLVPTETKGYLEVKLADG